ncbi:hypothetical protein S40293_11458 [Stachybotrys chartarum IBT 40293]|nr:hypothetical protein S40293_11458 [Stachybotrys chartarum IBT 40293]
MVDPRRIQTANAKLVKGFFKIFDLPATKDSSEIHTWTAIIDSVAAGQALDRFVIFKGTTVQQRDSRRN